MKIFICVDDSYGMMFNHRRQSKDKNLVNYINEKCQGNKLLMNSYSSNQFELSKTNILIDEDFLSQAEIDNFCFVENLKLKTFENKIESIYLCKWNRKYPSDFYFDINLENNFRLSRTDEIAGNSHEKITIEKWIKL